MKIIASKSVGKEHFSAIYFIEYDTLVVLPYASHAAFFGAAKLYRSGNDKINVNYMKSSSVELGPVYYPAVKILSDSCVEVYGKDIVNWAESYVEAFKDIKVFHINGSGGNVYVNYDFGLFSNIVEKSFNTIKKIFVDEFPWFINTIKYYINQNKVRQEELNVAKEKERINRVIINRQVDAELKTLQPESKKLTFNDKYKQLSESLMLDKPENLIQLYSNITKSEFVIDETGKININKEHINLYKGITINGKLLVKLGTISCFSLKASNIDLTTLEGFPTFVYGSFYIENNKLTSFQHCPKEINGSFKCGYNQFKTLDYCPVMVHGNFIMPFNIGNNFTEKDIRNVCHITGKVLLNISDGIYVK